MSASAPQPVDTTRRELGFVLVLTLASLALRCAMLDRPLAHDEAFTYLNYAASTLWNALSNYSFPNNHIFHSACVWASTHAFGLSVVSLRLPALLFGVALVPLSYLLAREVSGPTAAAAAAALVGGNEWLASFSVNARGYGVQAALFVAALLLVPRLVQRPGARPALALAVVLALALFTVPTLVCAAPVPFLWGLSLVLATPEDRPRRLRWLAAAAGLSVVLTGLLYAPALAYALRERVHGASGFDGDSAAELAGALLADFTRSMPRPLAWIALALAAIGAASDLSRRKLPLLATWIGVPFAMLALYLTVSDRAPFPRNFLFIVPLLCILTGQALERLEHTWSRRGASAQRTTMLGAAALLAALALNTYEGHRRFMRNPHADTRAMFERLARPLHPGDELAAPAAVLVPILVYAQIEGVPLARVTNRYDLSIAQHTRPGTAPIRSLSEPGQRFWLLAFTDADRGRVPIRLKKLQRQGRLRWLERERLPAHAGVTPTLWELQRADPR